MIRPIDPACQSPGSGSGALPTCQRRVSQRWPTTPGPTESSESVPAGEYLVAETAAIAVALPKDRACLAGTGFRLQCRLTLNPRRLVDGPIGGRPGRRDRVTLMAVRNGLLRPTTPLSRMIHIAISSDSSNASAGVRRAFGIEAKAFILAWFAASRSGPRQDLRRQLAQPGALRGGALLFGHRGDVRSFASWHAEDTGESRARSRF